MIHDNENDRRSRRASAGTDSVIRMPTAGAEILEHELLCHLAILGASDAPTLEHKTNSPVLEVEIALERLVVSGHVEKVGVSFRITDKGLKRLQGRTT